MSNIIQIKRGNDAPPDGTLAPYELGYDIKSRCLYIGQKATEENQLNSSVIVSDIAKTYQAITTAEEAISIAEGAEGVAQTSISTAQNAEKMASTASQTAADAESSAEKAIDTANQAQTKAESAVGIATNAAQNADDAVSIAGSASVEITEVRDYITSLYQEMARWRGSVQNQDIQDFQPPKPNWL